MLILIVDDDATTRVLLSHIVRDMGYDLLEAASGEQAVSLVHESARAPDLAIVDIHMPGIDGFETTLQLKSVLAPEHLPVIFLTSSSDEDIQLKCLKVGDDYLPKPLKIDAAKVKIKAHLKVRTVTREMQKKNNDLRLQTERTRVEHDIVENIFSNLMARRIHSSDLFRFHISPVSLFNGDLLLSAVGPSGSTYIAIGDVTGHGLAAAIAGIPIYPTFAAMAEKGLTVGVIAFEMNRALRLLLPDNMMLAITLMEIDVGATQVNIWSGGMPSIIITDELARIKHRVESRHPPLAAIDQHEFSQHLDIFQLAPNDRIYLFTDGVEECRNAADEMFGEQRLLELFDGQGGSKFDQIIETLENFAAGSEQGDDITLAEFTCLPVDDDIATSPSGWQADSLVPWKLNFHLDCDDLKKGDPIPQITQMLHNASGINVHQDFLSTILAELYDNALSHGLLKLDSEMKKDDEGFFEYYMQRKERLEALAEGSIAIDLEFRRCDGDSLVYISVTDSGDGFDFSKKNQSKDSHAFGRGRMIIDHLCESLAYSNGGRTVEAIYKLQR